jgi:hypothetical protein
MLAVNPAFPIDHLLTDPFTVILIDHRPTGIGDKNIIVLESNGSDVGGGIDHFPGPE